MYSLDDGVTSDDFLLDFIKRQVIYMQIGRFRGMIRTGNHYGRYALLLEPTGRAGNEFRRLGTAQIPEDKGMADGWEIRTVTIAYLEDLRCLHFSHDSQITFRAVSNHGVWDQRNVSNQIVSKGRDKPSFGKMAQWSMMISAAHVTLVGRMPDSVSP